MLNQQEQDSIDRFKYHLFLGTILTIFGAFTMLMILQLGFLIYATGIVIILIASRNADKDYIELYGDK